MSPEVCSRHPAATAIGGNCAACLLEAALAADDDGSAAVGKFTIQVPLGENDAGSVFLVRGESPWQRLLRLKRWRAQAPAGFLERFGLLKAQLERWREPTIVMPVTAWVGGAGCPSVLTEFRQGMPLLDSVKSGWLDPDLAAAGLRQLRDVINAAHARDLAHGSVVVGNVFVGRPDGAPYLLDFGLAQLLSGGSALSRWVDFDLDGFGRIETAVQALTSKF